MKRYKRILASLLAGVLILNIATVDVLAETSVNDNVTNQTSETDDIQSSDKNVDENDGFTDEEGQMSDNTDQDSDENQKSDAGENDTDAIQAGDADQEDQSDETTVDDTSDADQEMNEEGIETDTLSADGTLDINNIGVQQNGKVVTVESPQQLVLLSNCKSEQLKDITINISAAATSWKLYFSGTDTPATLNGVTYEYHPIGTKENPFAGSFTVQGNTGLTISAKTTLFGVLSSKATNSNVNITWDGDGSIPMLAEEYVIEEDNAGILFNISNATGCLFGEVSGTGTLTINDEVTYRTGNATTPVTIEAINSSGNAGLICNTLSSGTITLGEGYMFPLNGESKWEVTSADGNAGGLIGEMEQDTKLEINTALTTATSGLKVTATNGVAGGLVGKMGTGAEISGVKEIILNTPEISGSSNVGGAFGEAENINISSEKVEKITVNSPVLTGSSLSANVGGYIGQYALTGKEETFSEKIEILSPTLKVSGNGDSAANAGGYIGLLLLNNGAEYTMNGSSEEQTITLDASAKVKAYGAVIGKAQSDNGTINSLIIKDQKINSYALGKPYYNGGIIGTLGDDKEKSVYAEVSSTTVTVYNPFAEYTYGFGGVVSYLSSKSVLKAVDITILTNQQNNNKDPNIWEGGGIVGYADKGSAIEFSGTTDLSKVYYTGRNCVGQLVGYQDSALIYARGDGNGNGWTLQRTLSSELPNLRSGFGRSARVNDIGNYGEVIRLKAEDTTVAANQVGGCSSDLITMDNDTHEVTVKPVSTGTTYQSNTISLSSVDDFAQLAITWNSQGYFSADATMDTNSWSGLFSKNIVITQNIDLTGTGILGLTRDNEKSKVYTGIIEGNDCTLTLAMGEAYGMINSEKTKNGTEGSGIIYSYGDDYHSRVGLFARARGNVSKLKIDGNICFSNKCGEEASGIARAGGIAAELVGDGSSTISLEAVTASETITMFSGRNENTPKSTANRTIIAGGLYGEQTESITLKLESETTISTQIDISNESGADAGAIAGGIIGRGDEKDFKLACNSVIVSGGGISTDATQYAYVGGLIGVMGPTASGKKMVEIRDLTFKDNFTINASDASICGGLFGSIWANTKTYFMNEDGDDGDSPKLKVQGAIINAPKAEVGGLIYRSSGLMEIRDHGIDMSNLRITAGDAVGILVCHGERGKETISAKKDSINSSDSEVQISALYLLTTVDWKSAYTVSDSDDISINETGTIFDEFVAYTAASAEAITNNGFSDNAVETGNGIISLATENNGGVNPKEECTTYQNRTEYGKQHQTNACSRYYYDLNTIKEKIENANGRIDTPEELLIWSVYQYADKDLKSNFTADNTDINSTVHIIGGETDENELDMAAYSYYPINLDRKDITVQNVKIIFHNDRIESGETKADNKSTIGTSDVHTQHYTMHCGLFLNHQLGDSNTDEDKTTINNVTFSGSIGKVNGGSGALFAGNIQGTKKDSQIIKAKINIKKVTFDDLKVDKCGTDYAPLMINTVGSYSDLIIDAIETTDKYSGGTAVASSLIGNVGTSTADQISLSFTNIKLPDKNADSDEKGIFSHASLLESFQYASNSSATYNFYKEDDWNIDGINETYLHNNVTYGAEISETVKYENLQKWYYDESINGTDQGLVRWTEDPKDTWAKGFGEYLPYVYSYNQNKGDNYDEIKVNQRTHDISTGCGTYGHPYVIKTEAEAKAIANYISTGAPVQDWRVRIVKDQGSLCYDGKNSDGAPNEYVMQYDGNSWREVEKSGNNWVYKENGKELQTGTLETDVMRLYMANAYYDLQGEEVTTDSLLSDTQETAGKEYQLSLTDFPGFGATDACPFRGVLTSTTGATVILKGAQTGNGLIPYSYGSVITNLQVKYEKGEEKLASKTLTYGQTSTYNSDSFFGGVIGCILGGDNLIDNVNVEMQNGWLTLDSTEGNKSYLIPVGGYVGSICGGGVIFRNMKDASGLETGSIIGGSVAENATSSLYVNPYVGRVLNGFAFTEGCELNNTDKNYKINELKIASSNKVVTTTDGGTKDTTTGTYPFTTTVENAQGLLILSAVINSGATSGGDNEAESDTSSEAPGTGTNAYSGKINDTSATGYNFGNGVYGKIRNATYEFVGYPKKAVDDFNTSVKDEQNAPGSGSTQQVSSSNGSNAETLNKCTNAPYLIREYCNDATFYITGGDYRSVNITLNTNKDNNFDMSQYGTGYQGIGARYRTNAGYFVNGASRSFKKTRVIPTIITFDGQDAIIKVDRSVKEYLDDDFHAVSVGGIFNLLRSGNTNIQSVTVDGTKDDETKEDEQKYSISLQYYSSTGQPIEDDISSDYKDNVGVGGIIGSDAGATRNIGKITMTGALVKNLDITGPIASGGLIGNAGLRAFVSNPAVEDDAIKTLIGQNQYRVEIQLTDCRYQGLDITAKYKAGGMIGYAASSASTTSSLIISTSNDEKTGGDGSSVTTTAEASTQSDRSAAGGVVGITDVTVSINGDATDKISSFSKVQVKSNQHAGGIIGKAAKKYIINNIQGDNLKIYSGWTDSSDDYKYSNYSPTAGGVLGKANATGELQECTLNTSEMKSQDVSQVNKHQSAGGIIGWILEGDTSIQSCKVIESEITGGRAGGIVGRSNVKLTLKACEVKGTSKDEVTKETKVTGNDVAAGMVAFVTKDSVTMEKCSVKYSNIEVPSNNKNNYGWGAGSFIGDIEKTPAFNLYDCASEYTNVIGRNAGGMFGKCNSTVNAANILLNHVAVNGWGAANDTGILSGSNVKNTPTFKIAGLSLQNITAIRSNSPVTGLISEKSEDDSYNGYITFADYTGASTEKDNHSTQVLKKADSLLAESSAYPYVTASPKSSIKVKLTDDGTSIDLSGDGAAGTVKDGFSYAQTLINEGTSVADGHFAYTKTGVKTTSDGFELNLKGVTSNYNENQSDQIKENFPVVLISSGGDASWLSNYLNILTNGGFKEANALNDSSSALEVHTYICKAGEDGSFVVDKDSQDQASLQVVKNSSGKISGFQTNATNYDNTKNQFTLLAVTFKAGDGQYNLYIPIIVRRQMEVDFTATLDYGTQFDKTTYNNVAADAHLLESFGNTFAGYLTYIYNSADGEYSDYGWQNFIDAGGNIANVMAKSLVFSPMDQTKPYLPKGTQLSLIDCQNGDKVYYYTVSDDTTNSIPLSEFKDTSGSDTTDGKAFSEESIGELLDVQVSPDDSGKFVQVDADGKPTGASEATTTYNLPTVKKEGKYYRLAQSGETKYPHYSVTINEKTISANNESSIKENYYLIITIPTTASQAVVGALQTLIENDDIPVRLHYRLRKKDEVYNTWTDSHNNTPSTYSISGGYSQELKENKNEIELPESTIRDGKEISVADSKIYIDVEDAITFPNDQVYNNSDELYQQFTGGMQRKEEDQIESIQFPKGTSGSAQFYVYTKDADGSIDSYYVYKEDGTWERKTVAVGADPIPVGDSYIWTSSDGTMRLPLSVTENGENPISLKDVRKSLQNNSTQTSTFYVRVKMDAVLPGTALDDIPILEMENNALKNFAKMTYSAQISTKPENLSYSNNRTSTSDTRVQYYRAKPTGATLTFDAVNIDQLGINLLDLDQNLDTDKQHANIETTAIYDLSSTEGLQELLSKSNGVRFRITLSQKSTAEGQQEAYESPISFGELSNYLTVQVNSPDSGTAKVVDYNGEGTWTWTIPKSAYCDDDGNLISGSVFDVANNAFTQAIMLKVKVADIADHVYSNYKVELTAEVLDKNDSAENAATDNVIYTLVKINPEFVEDSSGN